ncbi:MAG: helix-turn-helix transcriptional regulator [bacterium]|nr:helix-turn-helix transcriptional regulator [bacterium]
MHEHREALDEEIEKIKRILSGNIKHYRKIKRISQQSLANICGLHRTYISDLENAKCNPTLSVLMVIADCLDVSLEDLLKEG